MNSRRKTALRVVIISAFFAVVPLAAQRMTPPPLGPPPRMEFKGRGLNQEQREAFLRGDFTIIKKVADLPMPVVKLFTEIGGTRLLMADPGQRFNGGDAIDASVPNMRLEFGGVLGKKCFVQYMHGGFVAGWALIMFNVDSPETAKVAWRGHCGQANDLPGLRSLVRDGTSCSTTPRK